MSARDAGLLASIKIIVSAGVLGSGFRALSDDDFARIVIAERFAAAPSLDPSGTSWLPFPFWVNGSVMLVLGRSVETARAVSFALGVASVLAVWQSGRWLGLGRRAAFAGAAIAAVFPYSAWLGVATVPELPTAALALLGIASLSQPGSARLFGALALTAACLSRYEAWPLAAVFALFTLRDALGARDRRLAAAAALSITGALGWLAHGILSHGDALFFVQRVSEYRRAIGAGGGSTVAALLRYPAMLLRTEPELAAFALTSLGASVVLGRIAALRSELRALAAFATLLAFLVVGDLRDGAATHHGERALLALWLWLALLGAHAFAAAWTAARVRPALIALTGLSLAPTAGLVRPWYAARDSFIDRSHEVAIGAAARRVAGERGRLLIDTADFGFYAVMSGFGAPERAEPVDDRDPRKPREPSPWLSPESLRALLARRDAAVVVAPRSYMVTLGTAGEIVDRRGELVLVRIR